jgi:hypothetical protein
MSLGATTNNNITPSAIPGDQHQNKSQNAPDGDKSMMEKFDKSDIKDDNAKDQQNISMSNNSKPQSIIEIRNILKKNI